MGKIVAMNTNTLIVVIIVICIAVGAFLFLDGEVAAPTETEQGVTENMSGAIDENVLGVETGTDGRAYLTDPTGKALYTTTKECTGECLVAWPPYTAPSSVEVSDDLSVTYREDTQSYHYTYKGEFLYYYQADTEPGDQKGEGLGDVWFLARP